MITTVPTIMVGGSLSLKYTCEDAVDPTGAPLSGYEVAGYDYVQGIHDWKAQCTTASSATATVDWGDNLEGGEESAALTSGTPIRVEVGLIDNSSAQMTGYDVIELQPRMLDRESAYGTAATGTPETGFTPNPSTPFHEVRVYDAAAMMSIVRDDGIVVYSGKATAEANSTGQVVYGYNWGASVHGVKVLPEAGNYTLTFTAPGVTLNGGTDTPTLNFTVGTGSSGHVPGRGGGCGHGRPNR